VSDTVPRARNKGIWAGWAMSGVVIVFLLVDAIMKLAAPKMVIDAGTELGFPGTAANRQLGVILLICTVIHIVPRTTVLGAILVTGYLGGAVATQMRVHAPVFGTVLFGAYLGILLWGGLWCREPRIRSLLPFEAQN
jgi:DoxX-like family